MLYFMSNKINISTYGLLSSFHNDGQFAHRKPYVEILLVILSDYIDLSLLKNNVIISFSASSIIPLLFLSVLSK